MTKPSVLEKKWAVVGGGLMGLTVALRLARAGRAVTLYEASNSLGGLAAAWALGDIRWDRHYHVTLLSDAKTRGLLRDLELEGDMRWVETKTGFCSQGRVVSMSNAIEYLALPGMTVLDKARVAGTILYASRVRDWRKLEQTPVEDWLVTLSGRSAFQRLWRPLLAAKLGDGWRDASAAFIWATIQRLYAARRTGLKKEMFGYVPGGYARIVDRFAERLVQAGAQLRVGSPVLRAGRSQDGVRLAIRTGQDEMEYDRVVLTTSPSIVAKLCPELDPGERERFEGVKYQGIVCASVLLERPLADYYLTYITDEWAPFTAVIEMTALVDSAELGGRALVYLPKYAPQAHDVFAWPDERIERTFLDALRRIYPQLTSNRVLAFGVSRVPEVFPLPRRGYSGRLPPMVTSLAGMTAVSSAQIVNGTLNVNDTVGVAERAAQSLLFHDGLRVYLN